MGVFNYALERTTAIPPAKFFDVSILKSDTVIPKLLPQAVKSIELLEGDGGPGSIKQVNFAEGIKYKYMKHKVEVLDKENFTYKYTIIEGDLIGEKIEKIENEIKIESSADGGSILKSSSKYHTIGDFELSQEEIKSAEQVSADLFKAIEAYHLANPNA